MAQLTDRIAVVTGATSGIGRATALLFAREGAAVVIEHFGHVEDGDALVADITASGGRAIAVDADVRDEAAVARLFLEADKAFGIPDILVNSAGVDAAGIPVAEMTLDHFENVLRTNLVGPFLTCRAFVQGCRGAYMKGRIVNVTSVHEDVPRAGAADYCASKGALRNLTRCLALEHAEHGITVNNLAPGMILTPMNQQAIDDPEERKKQTASIPMKRAGEPDEVAKLALYLVSDASAYATGATFTLDGGLQFYLGQGA